MEAPDKIYLPGDIDWQSVAILTLGKRPGDVEYIRKDALLEWAEEKRAALLNCDATEERKVAALSVCDTFIEKIKSL